MIFRLSSLDSIFVSAAVAAGALAATSSTEAHIGASFRGSANGSDEEFLSGDKIIESLRVPRKLARKNGVGNNNGLDLSLHLETREEKRTATTGANRQLHNTSPMSFSQNDDAGKDREDAVAVDTSVADNIVDVGILNGYAVPVNAIVERNLDQDDTTDREQYCSQRCGSERKPIYTNNLLPLTEYCKFNECDCYGEGDIDYRCPSEISCWDVSRVTNMKTAFLFDNRNIPVRCWDVSSVTSMREMFSDSNFDQNINDWNVTSVKNMYEMFYFNENFNQDISEWDLSSAKNMGSLFYRGLSFNQPIGKWSTSSVTNMAYMFYRNQKFNQDLSEWDVSSVTSTRGMFYGANSFNEDVGSWDVSSVTNMRYMFFGALNFDQYIGGWNVTSNTNMNGMFGGTFITETYDIHKFNQFIGNWDLSSVSNMRNMFIKNGEFNQPLQSWDVSKILDTQRMFYLATSFNQPLDEWDVTSIRDMKQMFKSASSFNQCLSSWAGKTVDSVIVSDMFRNSNCPAGIDIPDQINGPWCQDSSNQCYEVTCVDDPEFGLDGDDSKSCAWVAFGEASDGRCAEEGVFEACSQTCNPVCFGGCEDDPTFRLNGVERKSCDWVAKQAEERCKKPGVMDRCRATCNSSDLDPKCKTVAVDCSNDPNFRLNGVNGKDCGWVAKQKTDERCRKPGVMAACPLACNPSCGCRDSNDEFLIQAGSTITCTDLDIMECDAQPMPGPDEFSLAQLGQLEALLDPIHQRLDVIEDAVVGVDATPNKGSNTFRDLCPKTCKKCF